MSEFILNYFNRSVENGPGEVFLGLIPTGPPKNDETCFFHFSGGAIENVQFYRTTFDPELILLKTGCFVIMFRKKLCFVKDFFYIAKKNDSCHQGIYLPPSEEYKSPAAFVMDFIIAMAAIFRCDVIELEDVATKELKSCEFPLYLNKYRQPFRTFYGKWGFIVESEIDEKVIVQNNTDNLKLLKLIQQQNQIVAEGSLDPQLPHNLYMSLIHRNLKPWTPQHLCNILSQLCDENSDNNKKLINEIIFFLQEHYPENSSKNYKSKSTRSKKYFFYEETPTNDITIVKSSHMEKDSFVEILTEYTWDFFDDNSNKKVYVINKLTIS